MSLKNSLIRSGALSLALGLACGAALADDTEIFTGGSGGGIQPNIMFIIDTSGSMSTPVTTQVAYDPTKTYAGGTYTCDTSSFYFVAGNTGTPPACSSRNKLALTYLKCVAGAAAIGTTAGAPGFYTDNLVQWKRSGRTTFTYAWNATLATSTTTNTDVACQGDYPKSSPFPSTYNGSTNSLANEFTTTANKIYWNNGSPTLNTYTIYSGNYLNWYNYDSTVTVGTRISVVQQAATNLINSMSNVNIGLMRYSNNDTLFRLSGDTAAQGGMVTFPVSPVATGTNRADLVTTLNAYTPNGWTPLSETMYESYLYFSGLQPLYGDTSVADGAAAPCRRSRETGPGPRRGASRRRSAPGSAAARAARRR